MLFLLLLVLFLSLCNIRFAGDTIRPDYIGKTQTTAINGIFILLIFLSHSTGYLTVEGSGSVPDDMYFVVRYYLSQFVVVTFLFYSGYGIMKSIMNKGMEYVRQIPRYRFLRVLVMFDVAVAVFLIVGLLIGNHYPIQHILLAFTGYMAVGNSNWYIFLILILYIITYMAFMVFRNHHWLALAGVIVLTIAYMYIAANVLELETRYWNTAPLYAAGIGYALLQEKIDWLFAKSNIIYWIAFVLFFFVMQFAYIHRDHAGSTTEYCIWYTLFCAGGMGLVILLTMKVEIENYFISWMGKNLFPIYILQRLPMLLIAHYLPHFTQYHPYMFIIGCFAITMVLAIAFNAFMDRTFYKLFEKK